MIARDTEIQQDSNARERYEAARQRLTEQFGERVVALANVPEQSLRLSDSSYEHRTAVIESGLDLIVPLRRFIEQEVGQWIDPERLQNGVLELDDIVADTYLAAVEQADTAPVARAFYTWLRRIARREVRRVVVAANERERLEQSLDVAVVPQITDFDEPDVEEILQLIEILADPDGVLPEEALEQQETQRMFARFLNKLPEQWREVFLMNVVDGWRTEEISVYEGMDPVDVNSKVAMSRAFLRSWIDDARARGEEMPEMVEM